MGFEDIDVLTVTVVYTERRRMKQTMPDDQPHTVIMRNPDNS